MSISPRSNGTKFSTPAGVAAMAYFRSSLSLRRQSEDAITVRRQLAGNGQAHAAACRR